MKPNALMDVSVTGTLTGEVIPMDFDPEATAHLTSVLTNLYSDRILACIREYSTNAFDANVEAGKTVLGKNYTPIRVTTPNFVSPYLIIQDEGEGMDIEKIRNTYSKYGASTKRGSNDFNGMLGVGSKAALTYTPNFNVISVHNGVRYTVSVSLNEEEMGEMQVVDTSPTDAASGVTVQIPIKRSDNYEVQRTAEQFFSVWPEGSVLLNGERPTPLAKTHISGNLYTYNSRGSSFDGDLIVMGNVAYPAPGDRQLPENMPYFVYFAEIGEVNFSPSRESIRNDTRAKKVIAQVVEEYKDNFEASLQIQVDACETPADAVILAKTLNAKYPGMSMTFTFKGDAVPNGFPADEGFRYYGGERTVVEHEALPFLAGPLSRSWYLVNQDSTKLLPNAIIVTGAPKNMTPYNRSKLRAVAEKKYNNTFNLTYYITDASSVKSPWLKGARVLSWDDVNKEYSSGRAKSNSDPTVYEMYDSNGAWVKRRTEPGERYLFASPSSPPRRGFGPAARFWLPKLGYDYLVELSANRHNKFMREHDAIEYSGAAVKYAQEWIDRVPAERRFSMAVGNNNLMAKEFKEVAQDILDPDERAILARFDPELDKPWLDEYASLIEHGVAPELTHTREGTVLFRTMPDLRWTFSGRKNLPKILEIYNALYLYRKDKSNDS